MDTFRVTIKLTPEERRSHRRLKPVPGEAFAFWAKVSRARDLDYSTIIFDSGSYTALPFDHGKHWCWPIDLKCPKKAKHIKIEE